MQIEKQPKKRGRPRVYNPELMNKDRHRSRVAVQLPEHCTPKINKLKELLLQGRPNSLTLHHTQTIEAALDVAIDVMEKSIYKKEPENPTLEGPEDLHSIGLLKTTSILSELSSAVTI